MSETVPFAPEALRGIIHVDLGHYDLPEDTSVLEQLTIPTTHSLAHVSTPSSAPSFSLPRLKLLNIRIDERRPPALFFGVDADLEELSARERMSERTLWCWGRLLLRDVTPRLTTLRLGHRGTQLDYYFPILDTFLGLAPRLTSIRLKSMGRLLWRQPLTLFVKLTGLESIHSGEEEMRAIKPKPAYWRREILPTWARIFHFLPVKLKRVEILDLVSNNFIWLPFLVGALENMASLEALDHLQLQHRSTLGRLEQHEAAASLKSLCQSRPTLGVYELDNRGAIQWMTVEQDREREMGQRSNSRGSQRAGR